MTMRRTSSGSTSSGRVSQVQVELAGQFMLSVLDPQAADGARQPAGTQASNSGPEADLREGRGVRKRGPGEQPVQRR